jgi:hypothetical protein
LFLPLSATEKYQAKITIDAFFWRFGDLIQALAVYVGLNVLGFEARQFAVMNMLLAVLWIGLAVQVGRRYVQLKSTVTTGEPPRLLQNLQPFKILHGQPLDYHLPVNLFYCEAGDILNYSARPMDGEEWPQWLRFDAETLRFTGTPQGGSERSTWLTVRATNLEGQWAEARLGFMHQ